MTCGADDSGRLRVAQLVSDPIHSRLPLREFTKIRHRRRCGLRRMPIGERSRINLVQRKIEFAMTPGMRSPPGSKIRRRFQRTKFARSSLIRESAQLINRERLQLLSGKNGVIGVSQIEPGIRRANQQLREYEFVFDNARERIQSWIGYRWHPALKLSDVRQLVTLAFPPVGPVFLVQSDARGKRRHMQYLIAGAIGIVSGITSGLFGVGGGIVMVPAMMFFMKLPIKEAIGTSLAVIIPTALIGTFKHHSHGNVNIPVTLSLIPTALIGGYLGAWLTTHIAPDNLKRAFGGFLVLVGLRLLLLR